MKIKKLIDSMPANIADTDVKTIVHDSRLCRPGDLFVAISCDTVLDHIRAAVNQGAAVVVIEEDLLRRYGAQLPKCQYIPVTNTRSALSYLASRYYTKQPTHVAAVTGTNGKSSVVSFIRQICDHLGFKTASFGTLGLELGDKTVLDEKVDYPKLTTPDAFSLHKMLEQLAENRVTHFSFEASSHGLDQYRLHDVKVTSAGFTNLTQDHLDYHGTMENYFSAKTKLFTEILSPFGTAVINIDSTYGKSLQHLLKSHDFNLITYSVKSEANLRAGNIRLAANQIIFDLHYNSEVISDINLFIAGSFQLENVLCAIGQVMGFNIPLKDILKTLPLLRSARGRMQLVGSTSNNAAIYIDYAHTPDALSRALLALRSHVNNKGKLHLVFGCGGNRDAGKRALMGEIANELADVVYVTDDNPRHEDPQYIRAQILAKCPEGHECPDRLQAIQTAILALQQDDVLLVAGKGHETGQIIRDEILPFDDAEVVRRFLS